MSAIFILLREIIVQTQVADYTIIRGKGKRGEQTHPTTCGMSIKTDALAASKIDITLEKFFSTKLP